MFSAEELEAEANKIVSRLATGPTHAHAHAKALLNASLDNTINTQLDNEITNFVDCTATPDLIEGVTAFIEKRKPKFEGR